MSLAVVRGGITMLDQRLHHTTCQGKPQALQSAGYQTGIFGKWHLGDEEDYLPHNRGFNESLIHGAGGIGQTVWGDFPPNGQRTYFDNVLLHNGSIVKTIGFCTDLFFDAGLSWIKTQHDAKQPFFAYIATNAPHTPFIAPDNNVKRFMDMGWKRGKSDPAGRFGMIENIDDNFGRMMKQLDSWDALDNTLIVFMTDNGMSHVEGKWNGKVTPFYTAGLRGKKATPNEGGTRVPAFWQERELFVHVGRWEAKHPQAKDVPTAKYVNCAVRSPRWRFVNNTELYDISADPGETTDVAVANPDVVHRLRRAYDKWWTETVPLLVNEGITTQRVQKNPPLAVRYRT